MTESKVNNTVSFVVFAHNLRLAIHYSNNSYFYISILSLFFQQYGTNNVVVENVGDGIGGRDGSQWRQWRSPMQEPIIGDRRSFVQEPLYPVLPLTSSPPLSNSSLYPSLAPSQLTPSRRRALREDSVDQSSPIDIPNNPFSLNLSRASTSSSGALTSFSRASLNLDWVTPELYSKDPEYYNQLFREKWNSAKRK